MENKTPNAFKIPCKVENFVPAPRKSGMIEIQFHIVDVWALKEKENKPALILPDSVKTQLDPRATIMSGSKKGTVVVLDPPQLRDCPVMEFEDGQYVLIPDQIIVGEIKGLPTYYKARGVQGDTKQIKN